MTARFWAHAPFSPRHDAPRASDASGAPVPRASDIDPLRLTDSGYAELLAMARRTRRRANDLITLDTHALLHETFLRLAAQRQTCWNDHPHFLAAAACTMRRVVIDHVRRRRAAKRGGAQSPLTLNDELAVDDERDDALLALDDALDRLAARAPRLARVVECRYFAGMTEVETAVLLHVTERTVRRDWIKARGWLHAALEERM